MRNLGMYALMARAAFAGDLTSEERAMLNQFLTRSEKNAD